MWSKASAAPVLVEGHVREAKSAEVAETGCDDRAIKNADKPGRAYWVLTGARRAVTDES